MAGFSFSAQARGRGSSSRVSMIDLYDMFILEVGAWIDPKQKNPKQFTIAVREVSVDGPLIRLNSRRY